MQYGGVNRTGKEEVGWSEVWWVCSIRLSRGRNNSARKTVSLTVLEELWAIPKKVKGTCDRERFRRVTGGPFKLWKQRERSVDMNETASQNTNILISLLMGGNE